MVVWVLCVVYRDERRLIHTYCILSVGRSFANQRVLYTPPDSHPHTQPARLYHLDYTDCAASQKNSSIFCEMWVPSVRNS